MLGCAQHFMQLIRDKKFEKAISDDQILASMDIKLDNTMPVPVLAIDDSFS
jgi:hypothetical protein